MSLGHLWEFEKFDWERFFDSKACEVVGFQTWDEYVKDSETGKNIKSGKVLGVRIVTTILSDQTEYKLTKSEVAFSNRLKELVFKFDLPAEKCPVKIGDKICGSAFIPQGGFWLPHIKACVAYGQNGFKNDISIVVDRFEYIEKSKK